MPLLISLAALLTVAAAAIGIVALESSPAGWPFLLLGLQPVLTAGLMVTRHRYAEGFVRMTAMVWAPVPFLVLLPILLGLAVEPLPDWAMPTLVLGTIAGVAGVVALVAGTRFLRARV